MGGSGDFPSGKGSAAHRAWYLSLVEEGCLGSCRESLGTSF